MALFGRRDVDIQIVYDNTQFQQIAQQVHDLVAEVDSAVKRLAAAKDELKQARVELEKSLAKLQNEKRRPVLRST